jgi:Cytochrome P460
VAARRGLLVVVAASLVAVLVEAGPEKVAFPKDYQTRFFIFGRADNPATRMVRVMYVNPETFKFGERLKPMPYGTVLVAEDRLAKLDASGELMKDAKGRLVITNEVVSVLVQEKQKDWGTEYRPAQRTGEWEFAEFLPDGSRKADAKLAECRACHKRQAAQDYTFRFFKFMRELKD